MGDPVALLALVLGTGFLFGVVTYTGLRAQRRQHFMALGLALPVFGATVFVAEQVGRSHAFDPTRFRIHMAFAHAGVIALAAALLLGAMRIRWPSWRRAHQIAAFTFLFVLVAAVGTGAWMLESGVKRPAPGTGEPSAAAGPSRGLKPHRVAPEGVPTGEFPGGEQRAGRTTPQKVGGE
ncbi:MAG: hypothetical protein AAF628_27940 [Planctomycetota bacterium]